MVALGGNTAEEWEEVFWGDGYVYYLDGGSGSQTLWNCAPEKLLFIFGQVYVINDLKKKKIRSSHHGSVETNPSSIHEDVGSIPGLSQWVKDPALPRAVV